MRSLCQSFPKPQNRSDAKWLDDEIDKANVIYNQIETNALCRSRKIEDEFPKRCKMCKRLTPRNKIYGGYKDFCCYYHQKQWRLKHLKAK